MKKLIVFVCNGNIHRSVIAERCLTKVLKESGLDSKFFVGSYGLQGTLGTPRPLHKNLTAYPKEWEAAKPTLDNFCIDIAGHHFKKIKPAIIKKSAVVIAMDKKVYSQAKNALIKQFPEAKNKIYVFSELTQNHKDIKDPVGSEGVMVHQATIKNIYFTIRNKFETILTWAK